MKKRALTSLLFLGAGLLMFQIPAAAHHGGAAYDNTQLVTLTGTVSDFLYIQPHPLIYLDTKDASGNTVTWGVEMTAPNHLIHYGWNSHKLHPGQVIKVTGHAAKDGKKVLNLYRIYDADGKEIPLGPPVLPGQP
jgi:hypothetical protein